jgi:hypothetical protein
MLFCCDALRCRMARETLDKDDRRALEQGGSGPVQQLLISVMNPAKHWNSFLKM